MSGSSYYSESVQGKHDYFDLGGFVLTSGRTLPGAKLAYKTQGKLNAAKDNAILLPHMYSGTSAFMEGFIGEDRPLDPRKYFFILPGQFGNGMSSSPSNQPAPWNQAAFPPISTSDDVIAQHRLVSEHFGIKKLRMVSGWSMGAQQTYEWAVRFPDMMDSIVPFAGCARTPAHNQIFGDLFMAILESDPTWNGGFYHGHTAMQTAMRTKARAFAMMGTTPDAWRTEAWRSLGFVSAEDFKRGFVEGYFLPMDANNLICQARKWRAADVGNHAGGDLAKALGRIKAKATICAFKDDAFFPTPDIAADAKHISGASLKLLGTVWGHFTMFCLSGADKDEIDAVYKAALA